MHRNRPSSGPRRVSANRAPGQHFIPGTESESEQSGVLYLAAQAGALRHRRGPLTPGNSGAGLAAEQPGRPKRGSQHEGVAMAWLR